MDVKMVQYSFQDQVKVKDFILETWKEFSGYSYDPSLDYDLDDPEEYYIEQGGMFYVLKKDDSVIGTIGIINNGENVAEFKRLYIAKEYRGHGFGSQLVDTAIAFCQKNGFSRIEFETDKIFEKAHLLYNSRGFKTVRETEYSFYMEKDL